jgi:hypothetical protein
LLTGIQRGAEAMERGSKRGQLIAETAMRGDGSDPGVGELPRLDAFDQEFGQEPVAVLRGQRRQTRRRLLVGLLLAVGIISVPALAWLNADGRLHSEGHSGRISLQSATNEGPNEQVDHLVREVAALRQQVRELTEAHQQATDEIASLKAAEHQSRDPASLTYWYSDLTALNLGTVNQPKPVAGPPARRSATVRPERRRDNGEPLSLEAPQ